MPERSEFKKRLTQFGVTAVALMILLQLSQCGKPRVERANLSEEESARSEQVPVMIDEAPSKYPPLAYQARIEGRVWINAFVNMSGNVDSVELKKSSGTQSLDESAMNAAWQNKYEPAVQGRKKVPAWVSYKVDFKLPKKEIVEYEKVAKMMNDVAPEYPRAARNAGIEGTVWIKSFVNESGNVDSVKVFKSSGNSLLDGAASKVAWKNKFSPAIQNGKPAAMWVAYKVTFQVDMR